MIRYTAGEGREKVEHPDGRVEENVERVPVVEDSEEALAIVSVEMGYTWQPVKFESARIRVSLTLPCRTEQIDPTHEKVAKWVDERLVKLVEEARGES